MKSVIITALGCAILMACNPAKETIQESVTGTIEKTLESQTGTKVDLGDIDAYAESTGSVVLSAGGKEYLKKDEKLQAVAIFQKDNDGLAISFQMSGEQGKSLVIIANHIPENFTLPIVARFAVSNSYDGENPVATLLFMHTGENGMLSSPIPYEGTLTINRLNEKEIAFEVESKGGLPHQTESPSAWTQITASGILKSPIIQTYGIDKQKVLK